MQNIYYAKAIKKKKKREHMMNMTSVKSVKGNKEELLNNGFRCKDLICKLFTGKTEGNLIGPV